MRIFVDMDGTLAKWHNVEFEQLFEEGYYLNLEPNKEVLADVNDLIDRGKDVYILSAYLTESEYALKEKQEWARKYLPSLSEDKQIFVPYGEDKAAFLKKNYSPITAEDYLLDDYTKNLIEWESFGGTGLKYLNGINHTKGTWQGAKVNYEAFEHTPEIHTLSNVVEKHTITYVIVEAVTEHGMKQKYYPGIAAFGDDYHKDIESYSTLAAAKRDFPKYKSHCHRRDGYVKPLYQSVEYFIEKRTYDAYDDPTDYEYETVGDCAPLSYDDSHHTPEQYEIDFIACYEETKNIPEDKRITTWWGDYNMNALKPDYYFDSDYRTKLDTAEKVFLKRLDEAIDNSSIDYIEDIDGLSRYEMRESFAEGSDVCPTSDTGQTERQSKPKSRDYVR